MVKAWPENTRPESSSTLKEETVPNDFTYKGRNGKMLENPIMLNIWARNMTYRVLFQRRFSGWSGSNEDMAG